MISGCHILVTVISIGEALADGQPSDKDLVATFDRAYALGKFRTKYGHTQAPSKNRPWIYDAWIAGYEFGFKMGADDENNH